MEQTKEWYESLLQIIVKIIESDNLNITRTIRGVLPNGKKAVGYKIYFEEHE